MTLDQRVQVIRQQVDALIEEHARTRHVLAQVIGAHNYFTVQQGFFGRLRWLLFGPPTPKVQQQEASNGGE